MISNFYINIKSDKERRVLKCNPYASYRVLLVEPPPPPKSLLKFHFGSYFPLKILAFQTPYPLVFPITLLGVGVDVFWISNFLCHTLKIGCQTIGHCINESCTLSVYFFSTGKTFSSAHIRTPICRELLCW